MTTEPANAEKPPRVSVIVPVYNTQERLQGTIASLRMQNLRDVEVILVNDGSTDSSLAICREAAELDPRFKVLTGPNGGVCVARNKGLDVARGEWIAFCDSDDRVDPALYTTLLDLAAHERADLPSCALRDIGPDSVREGIVDFQILGDRETIRGHEHVMSRAFYPLLNGMKSVNGYLVVCLFRRDLIEARHIRFAPGITMCEDEMFMLDYLLSTNTIAVLRRDLYDYLRFEASACSTYYRRASDFKREYNWYLRARERQRIFVDGGLAKSDPQTARKLSFHAHYHEAQTIVCDPSLSLEEQIAKLYDLRRHVIEAHSMPTGFSAKVFHVCLLWLTPLTPLLLWAKRRKDAAGRKIDHLSRPAGGRQ